MASTYPIYQVDAFTDTVFQGNPAAVVILDRWPTDDTLLAIARENNLSETAFVTVGDPACDLRWFTPTIEVDLCGHATVACAYVLLQHGYVGGNAVQFETQSGTLKVHRDDAFLTLDFPARPPEPTDVDPAVVAALGAEPEEAWQARDLLLVFDSEAKVRALAPDLTKVAALDTFAVSVTAPGENCDFVSRYFAPRAGIPEDPVTGSAHCTLIPYWAKRLGKTRLSAWQVSARGGTLSCEDRGERVLIGGKAVQYLQGTISIPGA